MLVLDPDNKQASLWVDADGALLVTTDAEASNPLPVGATRALSLLVDADGRLLVSES